MLSLVVVIVLEYAIIFSEMQFLEMCDDETEKKRKKVIEEKSI